MKKTTNTETNSKNTISKLPYEKPCLQAVNLYADEVMGYGDCFLDGEDGCENGTDFTQHY